MFFTTLLITYLCVRITLYGVTENRNYLSGGCLIRAEYGSVQGG